MRRKFEAGQSILEYTLVLGAVIAVIVLVLLGPGGIKSKIKTTYDNTSAALDKRTAEMTHGIYE